jgi:hypothetical protein
VGKKLIFLSFPSEAVFGQWKTGGSFRKDESPGRLPAVGTLKGYSKVLEYEYRVKIIALDTLKQYSIISLALYLEWYSAYSIVGSGGPH